MVRSVQTDPGQPRRAAAANTREKEDTQIPLPRKEFRGEKEKKQQQLTQQQLSELQPRECASAGVEVMDKPDEQERLEFGALILFYILFISNEVTLLPV